MVPVTKSSPTCPDVPADGCDVPLKRCLAARLGGVLGEDEGNPKGEGNTLSLKPLSQWIEKMSSSVGHSKQPQGLLVQSIN